MCNQSADLRLIVGIYGSHDAFSIALAVISAEGSFWKLYCMHTGARGRQLTRCIPVRHKHRSVRCMSSGVEEERKAQSYPVNHFLRGHRMCLSTQTALLQQLYSKCPSA